MADGVSIQISSKTKYIISTSGRVSSLIRYRNLLQTILKLDIAYIPIHDGDKEGAVDVIDPQKFVDLLRSLPCIGGAISKDIKQTVIPFLDELDEMALLVNSVNTVIRTTGSGRLKGYNTDALGFESAILKGMSESKISVRTAVCYGYGGVASVVISVLRKLGIECYLCGRKRSRIESRSKDLGVRAWTPSLTVDLFVNATPASEQPLELADNLLLCLQGCKIAFDHEMPGSYLRDYCLVQGIHHIQGTSMYYPQMHAQWSLFLESQGVDSTEIPNLLKAAEELGV